MDNTTNQKKKKQQQQPFSSNSQSNWRLWTWWWWWWCDWHQYEEETISHTLTHDIYFFLFAFKQFRWWWWSGVSIFFLIHFRLQYLNKTKKNHRYKPSFSWSVSQSVNQSIIWKKKFFYLNLTSCYYWILLSIIAIHLDYNSLSVSVSDLDTIWIQIVFKSKWNGWMDKSCKSHLDFDFFLSIVCVCVCMCVVWSNH